MCDLRALDVSLQHLPETVGLSETHSLAPLRSVLTQLENYSLSSAFLPSSTMLELERRQGLDRAFFYDADHQRELYGSVPSSDEVQQIYEETIAAKEGSIGEAGWNTNVHINVLKMALRHSTHRDRLAVHNM